MVEGLTIKGHKGSFQGDRNGSLSYDGGCYTLKVGAFHVSYTFKKLI